MDLRRTGSPTPCMHSRTRYEANCTSTVPEACIDVITIKAAAGTVRDVFAVLEEEQECPLDRVFRDSV